MYSVIAVPVEKIQANSYNPNHVADPEMDLLYESIKSDGYTMPIVCYYLTEEDKYEIVDGFHRYLIIKTHKDIYERENGCLPVSVIDKPLDDRMASTIRHNRARGAHAVLSMSEIVKETAKNGKDDVWLAKELGMDRDEILRLKQIGGIAEAYKSSNFSKSWIPG